MRKEYLEHRHIFFVNWPTDVHYEVHSGTRLELVLQLKMHTWYFVGAAEIISFCWKSQPGIHGWQGPTSVFIMPKGKQTKRIPSRGESQEGACMYKQITDYSNASPTVFSFKKGTKFSLERQNHCLLFFTVTLRPWHCPDYSEHIVSCNNRE
jgi:hypothetical protein